MDMVQSENLNYFLIVLNVTGQNSLVINVLILSS